jgi:NAD-dependent deacetylase
MVLSSENQNSLVAKASRLIQKAQYCVALTGAGISTPSGIPDFRSPGSGLWNRYSPMEVASLSAFRYDPEKFYDWLRPFVKTLFQAQPNPAHQALAELEIKSYLNAVITQNIDMLHQKAGSSNVIEVHGSCQSLTCPSCFHQTGLNEDITSSILDKEQAPLCKSCGNVLKPDIILYEEQLPADKWKSAREAVESCDLLMILGSSLTVTPVSDLPYRALSGGAEIIIINQSCTHLDKQAAVAMQGDLADLLPLILKRVLDEKE